MIRRSSHWAKEIAAALEKARTLGRLTMTPEATAEWEAVYPALSAERPGLLGAILGRAEAQVIRLAVDLCRAR